MSPSNWSPCTHWKAPCPHRNRKRIGTNCWPISNNRPWKPRQFSFGKRFTTQRNMPEEIFDVVNEKDEVIAQMPRSQVHREGHKHRAVHVLVFNRQGEIF